MQNQKKTFVTSNIFRCESVKMIDVTKNSDERDPWWPLDFRLSEHIGTIHLRRRQIFTIFDPYPPTIGIPAKCLWRGFLILMYCDLWTIGTWGHPSPPKTCWRLKWMVPNLDFELRSNNLISFSFQIIIWDVHVIKNHFANLQFFVYLLNQTLILSALVWLKIKILIPFLLLLKHC